MKSDPMRWGHTPRREFPEAGVGVQTPGSNPATAGRLKAGSNWRVGSRRGFYRGRRAVGRLFYRAVRRCGCRPRLR